MILNYIIIILLNLYILFNKKQRKKEKLIKLINFANINVITINLLYYLIAFIYKLNINYIDLSFLIINIISYIPIALLKKKNKRKEVINEEEKTINYMFKLSILSYILIQRVGDIGKLNIAIYIYSLIIVFIAILISKIIKFLINNKHIVVFKENEQKDYLNDIKFNTKIIINKFYNYIIYILAYILFIYIKFPYYYIIYPTILIISLYIIYKKIKKIKNQSKKLYHNISIIKEKPGINYAFQFNRDILFTKNIMLASIFFVITVLIYFLIDITAFTYIAIELYIILIYIILCDKKKNIYNVYSLNSEFIDKKRYKTSINIPISKIKQINIFNIKFYKIECITDNNIKYESEIILYDPELYIDNITIYLNTNNIDDYIIMTNELYM